MTIFGHLVKFRSSKVQLIRNMTNYKAHRRLKCPIIVDTWLLNVMLKRRKCQSYLSLSFERRNCKHLLFPVKNKEPKWLSRFNNPLFCASDCGIKKCALLRRACATKKCVRYQEVHASHCAEQKDSSRNRVAPKPIIVTF